jgi:hypothetical protein
MARSSWLNRHSLVEEYSPSPCRTHFSSIAAQFQVFLDDFCNKFHENEISSKHTKLKSIFVSALFLFDINYQLEDKNQPLI